ncbi:MAG: hypothetical protein Aurels2KO_15190 [Aureliella sp.]
MNYLSHAYLHLDNPYFAAGTGLPDWMSVIDRKNRARRQYALPVTEHDDPVFSAFAKGCVQHHTDDFWFHQCPRFVSMSTQFAVELREILEKGLGHQAGFAGHIIVELLLDSVLCERDPGLLDRYYDNLRSLDVERLEAATNEICRKPVDKITVLVPRFIEERFLADYGDDEKLLWRLNGVMRRIGLPLLPPPVAKWLASARISVREHADELLTPPEGQLHGSPSS